MKCGLCESGIWCEVHDGPIEVEDIPEVEDPRAEARELVTDILKLGDHLAPIMLAHFTELRMDTDEDQALVNNIALLVQPWYDKIVRLRELSHEVE